MPQQKNQQPAYAAISYAAAICYKWKDKQISFLLVRTSSLSRWIFPKGQVEAGEAPWEAAEREAFEEGGVKGRIISSPLTTFHYLKANLALRIAAFLLEVKTEQPAPEIFRIPAWYTRSQAKEKLSQNRSHEYSEELCRVLDMAEAGIHMQVPRNYFP